MNVSNLKWRKMEIDIIYSSSLQDLILEEYLFLLWDNDKEFPHFECFNKPSLTLTITISDFSSMLSQYQYCLLPFTLLNICLLSPNTTTMTWAEAECFIFPKVQLSQTFKWQNQELANDDDIENCIHKKRFLGFFKIDQLSFLLFLTVK